MTHHHQLIYIHDPMCSWCWGFSPTLTRLQEQLPPHLGFKRLLGGLAPDNDEPMPEALQSTLQDTWRRIQSRIPGTRFNFDFWRDCNPRRSTWPACRAVIAARQANPALEQPMIEAIQHAYYLDARNPSDTDTLAALAIELGLNDKEFTRQLGATRTREILDQEIDRARRLGADSFPSLRLQTGDGFRPVPVDYTDPGPMLDTIHALMNS